MKYERQEEKSVNENVWIKNQHFSFRHSFETAYVKTTSVVPLLDRNSLRGSVVEVACTKLPCLTNFHKEDKIDDRERLKKIYVNIANCITADNRRQFYFPDRKPNSISVDNVVKEAASTLLLMRSSGIVDGSGISIKIQKSCGSKILSFVQGPVLVGNSSAKKSQPRSLYIAEDSQKLNSLHCFVRSQLLEITQGLVNDSINNSKSKRVGLRCIFCSHLPRSLCAGMIMCTFYPKSLEGLYRSVCTWQRVHFQTCKYVPKDVTKTYHKLKKSDRSRGKTTYWITSAKRLGFANIDMKRSGICFAPSLYKAST